MYLSLGCSVYVGHISKGIKEAYLHICTIDYHLSIILSVLSGHERDIVPIGPEGGVHRSLRLQAWPRVPIGKKDQGTWGGVSVRPGLPPQGTYFSVYLKNMCLAEIGSKSERLLELRAGEGGRELLEGQGVRNPEAQHLQPIHRQTNQSWRESQYCRLY